MKYFTKEPKPESQYQLNKKMDFATIPRQPSQVENVITTNDLPVNKLEKLKRNPSQSTLSNRNHQDSFHKSNEAPHQMNSQQKTYSLLSIGKESNQ